jgi:hypothetical protein
LNEFKINLNKKPTKSDQKAQLTNTTEASANSLIFKLFSDLDESDLDKANKVFNSSID